MDLRILPPLVLALLGAVANAQTAKSADTREALKEAGFPAMPLANYGAGFGFERDMGVPDLDWAWHVGNYKGADFRVGCSGNKLYFLGKPPGHGGRISPEIREKLLPWMKRNPGYKIVNKHTGGGNGECYLWWAATIDPKSSASAVKAITSFGKTQESFNAEVKARMDGKKAAIQDQIKRLENRPANVGALIRKINEIIAQAEEGIATTEPIIASTPPKGQRSKTAQETFEKAAALLEKFRADRKAKLAERDRLLRTVATPKQITALHGLEKRIADGKHNVGKLEEQLKSAKATLPKGAELDKFVRESNELIGRYHTSLKNLEAQRATFFNSIK